MDFTRFLACNTRLIWACLFVSACLLLAISHGFFQSYLFMRPCEQCVYIRFAMFCIVFGALLGSLFSRSRAACLFAFMMCFYGIALGIQSALTLQHIHAMVLEGNPFIAASGCKKIPVFPFDLPLHVWFPQWFLPTGECGLDAPMVGRETLDSLSAIQKFFIEQYKNGWWLVPQLQWINMATFCLLYFILCIVILCYLLLCFARTKVVFILSAAAIFFVVFLLLFLG